MNNIIAKYCEDSNCFLVRDSDKYGEYAACKGCEIYRLQNWLKNNDYEIIKVEVPF